MSFRNKLRQRRISNEENVSATANAKVDIDPNKDLKDDIAEDSVQFEDDIFAKTAEKPKTVGECDLDSVIDDVSKTEVAKATVELNKVDSDVGQITTMAKAMENYQVLIETAIKRGGFVDPLLAKSIQIGLESFGEPALARTVPALESFEKRNLQHRVSVELLDNVKDGLKKAGKATMEALNKIWEFLLDAWNNLVADHEELFEKCRDLARRASRLTTTNAKPVPLKGARRLSINGEFVGNTAKPIMNIATVGHDFLGEYPKAMQQSWQKFLKEAGQNHKEGDAVNGQEFGTLFVSVMSEYIKLPDFGMQEVPNNKAPSGFDVFQTVGKTETLPGDRAMYVGMTTASIEGKHSTESSTMVFDRIFKMAFLRTDREGAADVPDTVKAPDVATLKNMLQALGRLIQSLGDMRDYKTEIANIRKEITADITRLMTQGNKTGGEAFIDLLTSGSFVNGFSRAIAVPSGNYIGYLASTIKAYLALCESYINHHGGGNGSADGGSSGNPETVDGEVMDTDAEGNAKQRKQLK